MQSVVPPWMLEHRNSKSMTPAQQFTRDHRELVIEGEKWMKETASSCTVVGALIVTMTFAAAFTVPGGTDQDTGFPMFLDKKNIHGLHTIRCSIALFIHDFGVDVLRHPHFALCRRRFPRVSAEEDDHWPLHPFSLHCNHDGSFLRCTFHHV